MSIRPPLLLLVLVLGSAFASEAANITYDVDLAIGAGSVTGFIETDGTIGTIFVTEDIVDYNLLLNDGANTFDLLGPLSGSNSFIGAEGFLFATATQLMFNFDTSNGEGHGFVSFDWNGDTTNILDFNTEDVLGPEEYVEEFVVGNDAVQFTPADQPYGLQVIATAPSSPTPEPSTFVFLGAGIAFLGFRKRKALSAIPAPSR